MITLAFCTFHCQRYLVNALLIALSFIASAAAHKPSFANNYFTPDSAFTVIDPDISIVLYAEMTCEQELWMEMFGRRDLDRVGSTHAGPARGLPAFHCSGCPGPARSRATSIPEGMGATIISTDDVTKPQYFYEPFTQTESWILYQGWLEVPTNEQVFLVHGIQIPSPKLWLPLERPRIFDVTMDQFGEWIEKLHRTTTIR